jgi:hypothetical protein
MSAEMFCGSIIGMGDELQAENIVQNNCKNIYFMPFSFMAHSSVQILLLAGIHYAKCTTT